jgi:hypothetical protein
MEPSVDGKYLNLFRLDTLSEYGAIKNSGQAFFHLSCCDHCSLEEALFDTQRKRDLE